MRRKLGINNGMKTSVMTHMNEIGFLGTNTMGIINSLLNILMGRVFIHMQGIHDQHIQSFQRIIRLLWHGLHISNIPKSTDAEAQDREVTMHYSKRQNFSIIYFEGLKRYHFMQTDTWHSRVFFFYEAIGQPCL